MEKMKEELIQRQYELNLELKRGIEHIADISQSMKEILQEQNKRIEANTLVLNTNTLAVTAMERFWGKIMFILVLAIAVLAGADKILPFIK